MKIFKRYLAAIFLIGIFTMSFILCACNNDSNSTDNPDTGQSSGDEIIEPYTLALTQFYLKDKNPHITDYFDDVSKLNLAEEINSLE